GGLDQAAGAERHLLEVAALLTRGLQAHQLALGGEIGGGDLVAALAGVAAFKQVVGKEFHVGANPFRVDGDRLRLLGATGGEKGEQRQQQGMSCFHHFFPPKAGFRNAVQDGGKAKRQSVAAASSAAGARSFSGSPPSSIASQRVSGLASRAICSTMVSGTDSSMPTGPSTQPQNSSDRNTVRPERPRSRLM